MSTFAEWHADLTARIDAAVAAAGELAAHLERLPVPDDDDDAERLVAWRQRCGFEAGPSGAEYIAAQAERLTQRILWAARGTVPAAARAFKTAEAVMARLAREGSPVVLDLDDFAPGTLMGPPGSTIALMRGLPPDHFARRLVPPASLFPSTRGPGLVLGVAAGPWVPTSYVVRLTTESNERSEREAADRAAAASREAEVASYSAPNRAAQDRAAEAHLAEIQRREEERLLGQKLGGRPVGV